MKKIVYLSLFVIIVIFFLSFTIEGKSDEEVFLKQNFTLEEQNYIEENNIDLDILKKYFSYKNFNIYNFFEYEKIRSSSNNFLQAVNLITYPEFYHSYVNTKPALNQNTKTIIVNKHFYLSESYIPNNLISVSCYDVDYIKRENENMKLNQEALEKYYEMSQEAKQMGINLTIFSSYRSYEKQKYLYYVVNKENDNYSARPGYSEHQTGLVVDISTRNIGLIEDFKYSKEYQWLKENAYKFGFIERYPENKEMYTLYSYEPWHYRYVGKETSTYITNNNLTLEEYIIKNYEL